MNATTQSQTRNLLKPTALTTLLAFIIVGCSGGSSEGDQVPTFTSPRSSSNLTDTTNTPIDTSNGTEDETDDTDDLAGAGTDLSNQELLDAFEAQLNQVKAGVNENGDDLSSLKTLGIVGALALGATSIIGDRINHKNSDENRDKVLGEVGTQSEAIQENTKKFGTANALLNAADLKVGAQALEQGQKNAKRLEDVDGNISGARGDIASTSSSASEERAEMHAETMVEARAQTMAAIQMTEDLAQAAQVQNQMAGTIDGFKETLDKASTKEEVQQVRSSIADLNAQLTIISANQTQAMAANIPSQEEGEVSDSNPESTEIVSATPDEELAKPRQKEGE